MIAKDFPNAHTTEVQNPRLKLLNKLKAGEFPLMTFVASIACETNANNY